MIVVWVVVSTLVTCVVAGIAFWSGYFRGWHAGIEWADRDWWQIGAPSAIEGPDIQPTTNAPRADQRLTSGRAAGDNVRAWRSARFGESEEAWTLDSKAK